MAKLTGTNPDQVPTNADLGTMAYQDKDNVNVGSFTSNGIDDNASSTAMTLDASGNLLVGKTATTVSTDGFEVLSGGHLAFTRNNDTPVFLNRRTSDGSIIDFRKDNTTVGSIGVNGDRIYLTNAQEGIMIDQSANNLSPTSSSGTFNDNAMNLGESGNRWKDLYLSGEIKSSSGLLELNGNDIGGTQVTIADDAVASITPPRTGGFMMITGQGDNAYPQSSYSGILYYDVGASLFISLQAGTGIAGNIDTSTSDVTGTTGTDGKVTIAVQSGVIKVENRSNGTNSIQVTFL